MGETDTQHGESTASGSLGGVHVCGGAAVGGKPPGRDGAGGNVAEAVVAAAEHECRDSGAAGRLLDAKLSSRAESRRQGVF